MLRRDFLSSRNRRDLLSSRDTHSNRNPGAEAFFKRCGLIKLK
jgi:hypothetical protein